MKARVGGPGPAPGRGVTAGAAFLMATSAIGPGFLTQTAVFTGQLGKDLAFAILASVLLALAVQLNVWRVLGASGRRAPELASAVVPGLGPGRFELVASPPQNPSAVTFRRTVDCDGVHDIVIDSSPR